MQETLEAWNMGISRNPANGDIDHPAVVFIVDRTGELAYAAGGGVTTLVDLTRRLDASTGPGPQSPHPSRALRGQAT